MATGKKSLPVVRTGKEPKKMTEAQLANLKNHPANKTSNLKPWAPGQSGNPAGRPAKIYTVIKKMGYGTTDIKTAFLEMAFYTQANLEAVQRDKKAPAIIKVVAAAYLNGIKLGDMTQVKDLMFYVLGRPTQGIELGGPGGGPVQMENVSSDIDYGKLTPKALKEIIAAQIKLQQ